MSSSLASVISVNEQRLANVQTEIEVKKNLLKTRQQMLSDMEDTVMYKQKIIYTLISVILILIFGLLGVYLFVRRRGGGSSSSNSNMGMSMMRTLGGFFK